MPMTPTVISIPPRSEGPVWSRATTAFAKESFDVRSREDFVSALEAFAELSPGERAFHQAHLVFRQVQALDDLHRVLVRIDQKLGALDGEALAGLKHLPAVRKALGTIARSQRDMLDLMEEGQSANFVGDDDADDGDDGQPGGEDDDTDGDGDDDDDDEASDLADAVDADIVDDDDEANDGVEVVVPEVLPAGYRRESAITAADILANRRDGGET